MGFNKSSYERVADGEDGVLRSRSKKTVAGLALLASLFVLSGTSGGTALTSKMAFAAGNGLARTGTALQFWHGANSISALNKVGAQSESCECSASDCDALALQSVNGFVQGLDLVPSVAPTTTPATDWIVYFSDGVLETDGSGAFARRLGKIDFFIFRGRGGGDGAAPEYFQHGGV